MKKLLLLFVSIFMVLGLSTSAMAVTSDIIGIFTMIDPGNAALTNTTGMLKHTPFTGSISPWLSSQGSTLPEGLVGTLVIDPFVFFGATAYAHGYGGNPSPIDVYKIGAATYEAHLLFNWGAGVNIDVITRWKKGFGDGPSDWQAGGAYPAAATTDTADWQYAMLDDSGVDGISGHTMWNGPFPGFSANFDFNHVPEPASILLLGTGLLGLIGVARRRNK